MGAFYSSTKSGNSGQGIEWNRHFLEKKFAILGLPCEVVLTFGKIGTIGPYRSIRTFLLEPSFFDES